MTSEGISAEHKWLTVLAEFDRGDAWAKRGFNSCAEWLTFHCGLSPSAAAERVRVARALERFPRLSAAMARGEVNFSTMQALTRVATDATQETLLAIARQCPTYRVERLVRTFRGDNETEELSRHKRDQEDRKISSHHDDDDALDINARLPADPVKPPSYKAWPDESPLSGPFPIQVYSEV